MYLTFKLYIIIFFCLGVFVFKLYLCFLSSYSSSFVSFFLDLIK